jgi:tRNA G26 N,N-dimethylase Trm1
MRSGLGCEDCGESVWLAAGPLFVRWLRDREHIVREVGEHSTSGLETWMSEGLNFLDEHRGHSVFVISERQ